MPDVAVSLAEYLRNPALFTAAASPSPVAWAERGVESEIISPIYSKADADTEAALQAAFLAGPLVEDVVVVAGSRRDLMLRAVTISGDKLDYSAGVPAFVIGFNERGDGHTDLAVIRSLAP